MSRNRKPLSEQTKNLTISEKENLKQGEEHSKTLSAGSIKKSPPKWLQGDTARKEYRHLVKLLSENEFLGEIDSNNLAIYCNAFGKYIELENEYQNAQDFDSKDKILKQMTVQSENIRKYSALLGMTVDSRLKFGAVKTRTVDDDIADEFGDI